MWDVNVARDGGWIVVFGNFAIPNNFLVWEKRVRNGASGCVGEPDVPNDDKMD